MAKQIVVKTAVFKLHHPSQHKRAVLNFVLRAYTNAYRELLIQAQPKLDELLASSAWTDKRGNIRHSHRSLAGALAKLKSPESVNLSSALRDSLWQDVAGNLLSYIELKAMGQNAEYPRGRSENVEDEYLQMLLGIQSGEIQIDSRADYDLWRNRLTRSSEYSPSPILFCRLRDFNLQITSETKWGVELKLLPRKHERGETRLNFPLEFGEWHKTFLDNGAPKAAHLICVGNDYFLHVAFEFQVEIQEPQTLLGIDRGVLKQHAYALLDLQGNIIQVSSGGSNVRRMQLTIGKKLQTKQQRGKSISRKDWKQRHLDQQLHILTNEIVSIAQTHKAQVVVEDLNIKTVGAFTRSQFAKFLSQLSYKLPLVGLPKPREVFAAYSSKICSDCGSDGERNKDNREVFRCLNCGVIMDADENAAVNIGRRFLYRKSQWEARGGYRGFHNSFAIH